MPRNQIAMCIQVLSRGQKREETEKAETAKRAKEETSQIEVQRPPH